LKTLARPFNIDDHKVTHTNYSTGGTVVYLDLQDDRLLSERGFYQGVGT
jgi:hypothetical protein